MSKVKCGIPKLKELTDISTFVSASSNSLESITELFKASITELGKLLAKSNNWNKLAIVSAVNLASELYTTLNKEKEKLQSDYQVNKLVSEKIGYSNTTWQIANKCCEGESLQHDFSDLYNRDYEIFISVNIVKKLKTKSELALLGVK